MKIAISSDSSTDINLESVLHVNERYSSCEVACTYRPLFRAYDSFDSVVKSIPGLKIFGLAGSQVAINPKSATKISLEENRVLVTFSTGDSVLIKEETVANVSKELGL